MYHPDYLGNNEFISDLNGDPYQYFWYSAFGEAIVSDHSLNGTYDSPYRFNGKELDQETNLYYYGRRYYDPRTSVWLSVDRLAAKYPNLSPYVFSENNPVNIIDPNGDSTLYVNKAGEVLHISHDGLENSVTIIDDDNIDAFNKELKAAKKYPGRGVGDKLNSDKFNKKLRSYGQNYDIDGIKDFYTRTADAQSAEDGNYLYVRDGMVRVGPQANDFSSGDNTMIDWSDNPDPIGDAVGNIHSHEHPFASPAASSEDFNSHYDNTPYRDVIPSSKGQIYFHNSSKAPTRGFLIPMKNTFKR